MVTNPVLFSSKSNEWTTPQWFFDKLDKEFNFTLDPCCTNESKKCDKFYTKEDDGLSKDWSNETVFVNPPYGSQIGKWVKKCYEESLKGTTVVMLIPARTDTRYFHDYIWPFASQIRFFRGRLGFGNTSISPFPSCVCVFGKTFEERIIWDYPSKKPIT